jgi:nucleotide-binding universal stress UspA family protein
MNPILVPVDFSGVSRAVISEATKLARLIKCPLTLVHVVQPPPIIVSDFGPAVAYPAQFIAESEKSAAHHLVKHRDNLRKLGVEVDTVLTSGVPEFEITELAKKRRASYIVIGSHGHTAFYDLLVGSTTGGVLKRSPCPVLVVSVPPTGGTRGSARKSQRSSVVKPAARL